MVFMVEDNPKKGYSARALGAPIFVVGEDFKRLRENAWMAVCAHFPHPADQPDMIRLSYYAP